MGKDMWIDEYYALDRSGDAIMELVMERNRLLNAGGDALRVSAKVRQAQNNYNYDLSALQRDIKKNELSPKESERRTNLLNEANIRKIQINKAIEETGGGASSFGGGVSNRGYEPEESDQTQGYSDRELLSQHQQTIVEQDKGLLRISDIVKRQKEIGITIGDEIDGQNVVLRKHSEFHKMGLDMSSAFDTIKRSTILRLLEDAGCSEDDIRLVRLLLANTRIRVRVNSEISVEFISTNGAFQGDCLSGTLFTLSMAGALYQVRAVVPERPNPPISDAGMPLEWEYSDDVDFLDPELGPLQELLPKVKDVLSDWNLRVNESKTEFVHFYVAGKDDVDTDGVALSGNEPWRFCKSLGSLLCSTADIGHRIILAHSAFQSYSRLWLRGTKIPLERKLVVYEAQVISVLMYGCGSWSAPKHVMEKLNVCQRRHLRTICNIHYPGVISNRELYRRCRMFPITERVRKARWTLLGHILRMDDNCPASLSLRYAIDSNALRGRRGRPRTNLFSIIQTDLKAHAIRIDNANDLLELKWIAYDRAEWRNMFVFNDEIG